jgi:hypothetical protein
MQEVRRECLLHLDQFSPCFAGGLFEEPPGYCSLLNESLAFHVVLRLVCRADVLPGGQTFKGHFWIRRECHVVRVYPARAGSYRVDAATIVYS